MTDVKQMLWIIKKQLARSPPNLRDFYQVLLEILLYRRKREAQFTRNTFANINACKNGNMLKPLLKFDYPLHRLGRPEMVRRNLCRTRRESQASK